MCAAPHAATSAALPPTLRRGSAPVRRLGMALSAALIRPSPRCTHPPTHVHILCSVFESRGPARPPPVSLQFSLSSPPNSPRLPRTSLNTTTHGTHQGAPCACNASCLPAPSGRRGAAPASSPPPPASLLHLIPRQRPSCTLSQPLHPCSFRPRPFRRRPTCPHHRPAPLTHHTLVD